MTDPKPVPPFPSRWDASRGVRMKKKRDGYCQGCGHRLNQHREYAKGITNRHGCRLVCIVDNCQLWQECREPKAEGSA
jgi:hypothetical protein